MLKQLPWIVVAVLALSFGGYCYKQGIYHEQRKAEVTALKQAAQSLQAGLKWYVGYADSLTQENARRDVAIRKSHAKEMKAKAAYDSLLARFPLAQAPEQCRPYTEQVTLCEVQLTEVRAQRDSVTAKQVADSLRADSATKLAKANKVKADSLLDAWPKPSLFKDLTKGSSFITFVAGVLAGLLAK